MTVSPIKSARQQDDFGQVVSREAKDKEHVKRWRGFQFFFRFQSRETLTTFRSPSSETARVVPRLLMADIPNGAPLDAGAENVDDSKEMKLKDWTIAAGCVPPDEAPPH